MHRALAERRRELAAQERATADLAGDRFTRCLHLSRSHPGFNLSKEKLAASVAGAGP
jgi:hypothetical protein